ncbi:MAG: hypothetical protein ABI162_11115 [Luteolibacter sp.]
MLLISAGAALSCWKRLPGTEWDQAAFTVVAGSFANPPLFVSGRGTYDAPWKLGSMTAETKVDTRQAPVIVSLGDDLEGFFQTSPPAPIDLAVIFSNFQRLGTKKAATAAVFSWEAPDPIGLAALDKALGSFDSLVMAAPLSRGAVPAAMPPAFRRASIPLANIHGDSSALPVVNRIPLPGVILGGENSVAGFSSLESESAAGFSPLVARWEDRVVFAFPLLVVLQRNNFPVDGVDVHLGEYLKLSPDGPVVPLDSYGRLAMPLKEMAAYKEISAEALIDGGDELFPKTAPDPVILRDDQSAAEPATRAFSQKLSAMVTAIGSNEAFSRSKTYPRLAPEIEWCVLGLTAFVLSLLSGLSEFKRHICFGVLAALLVSAQWIGAGMALVWLPGLPALSAIIPALIFAKLIRKSRPKPVPEIAAPAEPLPEIEIQPEPEPKSEKAPAEKPPAEEADEKKAATPRKPHTKKPPTDY